MMNTPRILVILPAFNEGLNIATVVKKIQDEIPSADVLVINDGSKDDTAQKANEAGAIVLNMPYNVGIGAAVQTGFQFAATHAYDIVVRNDGDGQHSPEGIHNLLARLQADDVDVVIGSRFIGEEGDYGTPFARRMGITILAKLLSLITGQRITDPTSGFCAFNRKAILLFAQFYPHDYPEPEAIVISHRTGLHQVEIPVNMIKREHGTSSITPVRSIYYMIKVILAILINLLRQHPQAENST
jgi:glycosyltransferase involved in cell wall biosynthesis